MRSIIFQAVFGTIFMAILPAGFEQNALAAELPKFGMP